jgi:NAD+ synthase (glutamine-hydrolysing)
MKIAIAQTKPVTGDLEGNTVQIVQQIRKAKADGVAVLAFPETAVTGYCCGALFEQEEFVRYNKTILEDIIAKEVPESMVAVVGFVDIKGKKKSGKLNITNSAAIIQGGKVLHVYDKILLANDNHHEDKKYFTPGTNVGVFKVTVQGETFNIGTPICEDVWAQDHSRDIVKEMKDLGADLIISPNYSYFYYGKQKFRHALFGGHAHNKEIPVIAVNAVGVGDIVKNIMIYDGGSRMYDCRGNLVSELERFVADYGVVDIDLRKPIAYPKRPREQSKYEEIFDALVFEQKELFRCIGLPNAQVHVSGGIDSAITAAIVAQAMGKEHTVLISNPTEDNGNITKNAAQHVADKLGIKLYWNSTQEPYKAAVESHKKAFGREPTPVGKGCLQAVLRTAQGVGAYHTFKSGIVATGNHTEIVLGWATFHDIGSIGAHAIIGDLTKTELFQFAPYINQRMGTDVIPEGLYDGTIKPAAELADTNEDPIDYYIMSGICAEIIRNRKSINDLVESYKKRTLSSDFFPIGKDGLTVYDKYKLEDFAAAAFDGYEKSRRSVFKSAQAAPTVIISPRSRGFSNRETIINGYHGWYDLDALKKSLGGLK